MRVSSGAVSHSRITPKAVSVAGGAEITTDLAYLVGKDQGWKMASKKPRFLGLKKP